MNSKIQKYFVSSIFRNPKKKKFNLKMKIELVKIGQSYSRPDDDLSEREIKIVKILGKTPS